MRAVAVAAVVAACLLPVPASADPARVSGLLCGFSGDHRSGRVEGGPLVTAEPGTPVELTCTIQAGPTGRTHAGPDAASASAAGTGAAVLAPVRVTYPWASHAWLCAEVTVSGVTHYWDDTTGAFSSDSSADCALASHENVPPDDPHVDYDIIDCPILAVVFPPGGDVVLPEIGTVWDCPPDDGGRWPWLHVHLSPPAVVAAG